MQNQPNVKVHTVRYYSSGGGNKDKVIVAKVLIQVTICVRTLET